MEKKEELIYKICFQAYEELFEHTPSLQSAVEQLGLIWEEAAPSFSGC